MQANFEVNENRARPRKGVEMKLSYTGVPTNEYDNGRDEKPWQRVVYQMTKKGKHLYEPVKSLPSTYLVLLLGGYLLLGYLTQLVEDSMPSVVNESDVARDVHDVFSEESARRYLDNILGSEPRVAGTPYHVNKTRDLLSIVETIAAGANQRVLTTWQMHSDDYYRNKGAALSLAVDNYYLDNSAPYLNVYEQASNVIAVLEGESGFLANGTIGSSILVNCHYDSVPFAMGASDNAVFCAVLAETLSKMSRRSAKFKHNIVFLFNGAEENGLQASHGFLSHEWSRGVKVVVNLDAAGMNGKPAVFQVNDIRVLNAFKRSVYRPNAQGVGEFLFSSGIIPSDTDFRIFRDFGDIHGIDIAFAKWGHVYHTRYDHPDLIQQGVVQNAGNLMMALLSELADMDEMAEKLAEPTTAVFFDYLNLFVISYTIPASYAVDAAIVLIALGSVAYYIWLVGLRWSMVRELLFAVLSRLASLAAGVLLAAVCAALTIATTIQLRYLSEPWLVVPLFWVPYMIGAVAASQAFDAWRIKKSGLNRSIRTLQAQAATRLLMAVVMVVLMCIPPLVSTRYMLTVPLFLMSTMALVSLTVLRLLRLEAWQHLWLEIVLSLPTVMFAYTLALRLDAMMLPIMGRSANSTPDVTVALINVGMAILCSATMSGIELLFSRRRLWLCLCCAGAVCFVLFFIPFAPYRDDGPATMRHYWFHSEIVTYNENKVPIERTTGVVVNKVDANTIPSVIGDLAAGGVSVQGTYSNHCSDRVYCDLPLFRTGFGRVLDRALILATEGPAPFTPAPSIDVTRTCTGETCVCTFTMIGTAHNTLTIWPYANVNMSSWSFNSPERVSFYQLDRPVYVIVHSKATYNETVSPYTFSATFTVPLAMQSGPIMQVSHHAHKIYHPELFTPFYQRMLNAVPKYYNIATFLSYKHNYVF